TTADGRTGDQTGPIDIVDDTLPEAEVTVDLTGITTDRAQRNRRVRSALETETFPEARFVLTEPVAVPAGSADGSAFAFDAVGDLTLHGVTRSVTFAMHAQLVGGVVVVVGSTDVVFDDYGVTAPSAPIVVSVEDHGVIELQLLFTR
ncbi:MAG: YceI family protein, partial [Acidimicrobiales bacterium]